MSNRIVRREDGFWILGLFNADDEIGPYPDKPSALASRDNMLAAVAALARGDRRFFTSQRRQLTADARR